MFNPVFSSVFLTGENYYKEKMQSAFLSLPEMDVQQHNSYFYLLEV